MNNHNDLMRRPRFPEAEEFWAEAEASPECLEGGSVLKNSLDTRFRSGSGTKHADFGAFRTQFVVATSPMPTFSTRWWVLGRPPTLLVASEDRGDVPRISNEEAFAFVLHLDTGGSHPLAHRLNLLRVVEHDGPVAQTYPALRDGRYALATPDVEAEVMMVAAGGHERRGTGHERHELEAKHVAVEGEPTVQIADVQVHVADHEPRTGLAAWLLAGDCA